MDSNIINGKTFPYKEDGMMFDEKKLEEIKEAEKEMDRRKGAKSY